MKRQNSKFGARRAGKSHGVPGGCQLSAKQFNTQYPIGTQVRFYPVAGDENTEDTKTRSPAWELPNGQSVVLLEGRAGGCALDHLVLLLLLLAMLAGCTGDPASSDRDGWDPVPTGTQQQGGGQSDRIADPVGMAGAGEYPEPGNVRLAPRDASDATESADDAGARPWWLTHSDGGTDAQPDASAPAPDAGSGSDPMGSGSDPSSDAGSSGGPVDAGASDAGAQPGTDAATGAELVRCKIDGGQQFAGQVLGCDAGRLFSGAVVMWPEPRPVGQPGYTCASSSAPTCATGTLCSVFYNGTSQHGVCL